MMIHTGRMKCMYSDACFIEARDTQLTLADVPKHHEMDSFHSVHYEFSL